MNIQYIRHKFGGVSNLLPDEPLLYGREKLRAVTLSSAINRGIWSSLTCFGGAMLRVTDRRILLSGRIFPCYTQEAELWFGGEPEASCDLIQAVSLAEGAYGRCIEVCSRNSHRRRTWFTSPDLVVRIFCDNAAEIEDILRQRTAGNSAKKIA